MDTERYRTLPQRLAASVVDLLPIIPFIVASFYFCDLPEDHLGSLAISVGTFLVSTVYFIVMHALSGQTIGKRLFKVRVVHSEDETAIGWKQSILRESPMIVFLVVFSALDALRVYWQADISPAWLPATYLFFDHLNRAWTLGDALSTLFNDKRRSLHDYIGRTVVVRTG